MTLQLKIENIERISSRAQHSAFCDLITCDDQLLACYRQATNHVSGDGRIETCLLDAESNASLRQHLWLKDVDLRDPKISRLPDGRILLIAYARHRDPQNKTLFAQSVCWTSFDGKTWSSMRYFGPKNWWIWRLRWHKSVAYGLAYDRAYNRVDLWYGHPLKGMYLLKAGVFSLAQHGKGYPNESDLWFDENDAMHVILRRDADTFSAQYGMSKAPYTNWLWQDLKYYVGGPVAICVNDGTDRKRLIAGRSFTQAGLKTTLWELKHFNTKNAELLPLMHLPSAGDNSYPGIVEKNNVLWILYYSSHIDDETRVYLSKISWQKSAADRHALTKK